MKKLNLIKRLWTDSHEKQKPQRLRRYAVMLMMLLSLGVGQMWAVSFAKGETIYYNFTNITTQGGANWWNGSGQYDANAQGTVKVVTFANATSSTDGNSGTTMIKTAKGSWAELKSKARSAGQNMLVVASDGKSYSWSTARTFKSGKTIYFKDHSSNMSTLGGSTHWKNADGNVYAKFWDGSSWTYSTYGDLVSGSWNGNSAIYKITVPGSGKTYTKVVFTRGSAATDAGTWNTTAEQYPEIGQNLFTIADARADGSSIWIGSWDKYAHNAALLGEFNNWDPCEGLFPTAGTIRVTVNLAASTSYRFTILKGSTYYACTTCAAITGTTENQQAYSGQNDFTLTTEEAGEYLFHWDNTNNRISVYYPKARLTKQTYFYFDARNSDASHWNQLNPIAARFYFKYYDSGVDQSNTSVNTPLETSVLYTTVPNNDWIGKVQINRLSSDKGTQYDDKTNLMSASTRTNSTQNCLVIPEGQAAQWSPTVQWTTYCPPTKSETFTDNSTTKISWQPNTNDGSTSGKAIWVKTGTTLKVSATASKAVADDNMTIKYDFKVDGTSQQNTATATYTHSASTNNTTYELSADIYTNYNLDNTKNSTKHTQSSIFYKALDTYSVTHTLSGVTKASGRAGDDAAAYHVSYASTYTANAGYYLPSDITVSIGGVTKTKDTDYTWTVTSGTSGALTILTDKIDDDVVVTINGVWRWSIATDYNAEYAAWNCDAYPMGNFTTSSGDDFCSINISLPANEDYEFKVIDRNGYVWNGVPNDDPQVYLTYTSGNGDATSLTSDGGNMNIHIHTAGAGDYTFLYNITDNKVTVSYPTSYYVTAAGNPAAGGTATPSSATYMSTSVGGEITATPNYSHYFNGWTSSAGGTFTSASSATTTFKPASAAATVTAAFPERTAFIEGNFQIYNSTRATRTKTGNSWQDASTAIQMTYDAVNNRYYLHTYSTPAELAEQLNSADAYFYIKTSTSSSSIADAATYKAYSSDVQSLTAYGSSNKKATGSSSHSFKFTGSEDGYVIIYFNGTHVWYELECALSYYGGEGATGDAPAERTYYAYNSNQTAASNTYSKTGYVFDHWDTASDDSGSDYDEGATNVAMNAHEVCLHAMWKVRYGLYGSLDSNDGSKDTELAGMPGWPTTDPAYEPAAFSYSDGTYTISRTLTAPNTTYKFRVVDHTDNTSYGLATKTVIPENTATKLGSTLADAQLATAGTGSYTFTVVEDDGYPKVTIVNPLSYSITYGINGGNGSWTSVEDGEGNAITSGQYVKNGGSIIFTASPNTGYQVEGWYSNADCSTAYTNGSDGATISGAGDIVLTLTVGKARTVYVKFEPKTYDGTLKNSAGESIGTYTATYAATTIAINDPEPTNAGYDIGGYYLNYNAEFDPPYLTQIASAAGSLAPSTSYTDSYGKWNYTSSAPDLIVKWVPKTYTITLSPELSPTTGTNGSPYFTVTIGSNNYRFGDGKDNTMTKPTREGYTFNGYWTASSGGVQIFNAEGGIQGSKTGYTDASSNWDNTTDDLVLYAHWTDNGTYYFKGGTSGNETNWNTAANWTKGQAPDDATDDVYILAPVVIPASATTSVNSVRIATNGSYTPTGSATPIAAAGKLTIPATAMLKVTTDVQNYDFSTSSASATTTATLHIQSASSGNGALVWGSASSTPGAAQVDFYTKSSAGGTGTGTTSDVNQYIGTPFSDESNYYNYYNSWVFQVNAAGTAWERLPMGSTMYPFVGYDVIYDGAAGHTFEMEGTLVSNADKTCTLSHTTDGDENLLANSWTAPMWIKGFAAGDFTNADAAIYIFNSTSEKATEDAGYDIDVAGGNYTAYTPGTSDAYIPSMQSFSVLSDGGGAGSVTLDYSDLVLNPASHSHIGAMYAPRRVESEEPENEMTFLRLRVDDENGWADELKIYIREDFVYDFENGFDARKMYGDERAPMLYGMSIDGMMAIHCIPTAENQVVGFHAGTASSEYTFRFTYDGEEELYLKDTKLNTLTLIGNENSYHFYAAPSDSDMRFIIVKNAPQNPTGVDKLGTDANIQKIMHDGVMYILRGGRIYDATGALVK